MQSDAAGRPLTCLLTLGDIHDMTPGPDQLGAIALPRKLLADEAYDAGLLSDWLAQRGAQAIIPAIASASLKTPISYNRKNYKSRNIIGRMFRRLKDFQRIANRYATRADIFLYAI